jgi:hypothetical protein
MTDQAQQRPIINKDDIIFSRPSSAPPNLEITNSAIFGANSSFYFENGITDIRESPQYAKFYQNNQSKLNLPPPLHISDVNVKCKDFVSLQKTLQSIESNKTQDNGMYLTPFEV